MEDVRQRRFDEILDRVRPRLARIARAYAPGGEAQDLYQEILLQIWRSLDRFEGRAQVDTWAYRVALNTALTWQRRQATQPVLATETGHEPAGPAEPRDPLRVLDDFLASLGKADRALLLLYLDDLTYREMAEILGISENYVGVKLNRLKQAFIERHIEG